MGKKSQSQSNNLDLWNKVEKTDPDFTKEVTFGRKFTAIDPTYQMKNATAQFGQYGEAWGLKDMTIEYIDIGTTSEKLATLQATFFTPEGEVATANAINVVSAKGKADADFMKKIITNTISKELSRLGFNADVFLGKFDDERYVQAIKDEKLTEDLAQQAMKEMEKAKDLEGLQKYFIGLNPKIKNNEAVIAKKDLLKEKFETVE